MDKMLSYAKLQKKTKTGLLDLKSENYISYFFGQMVVNMNFRVFTAIYKTRWRLFQGLGLHFSQWFLVCCQK